MSSHFARGPWLLILLLLGCAESAPIRAPVTTTSASAQADLEASAGVRAEPRFDWQEVIALSQLDADVIARHAFELHGGAIVLHLLVYNDYEDAQTQESPGAAQLRKVEGAEVLVLPSIFVRTKPGVISRPPARKVLVELANPGIVLRVEESREFVDKTGSSTVSRHSQVLRLPWGEPARISKRPAYPAAEFLASHQPEVFWLENPTNATYGGGALQHALGVDPDKPLVLMHVHTLRGQAALAVEALPLPDDLTADQLVARFDQLRIHAEKSQDVPSQLLVAWTALLLSQVEPGNVDHIPRLEAALTQLDAAAQAEPANVVILAARRRVVLARLLANTDLDDAAAIAIQLLALGPGVDDCERGSAALLNRMPFNVDQQTAASQQVLVDLIRRELDLQREWREGLERSLDRWRTLHRERRPIKDLDPVLAEFQAALDRE